MTENKRFTSADEITINLSELDLDFSKNLKSVLMEWILSEMVYYEELIDKTDGYNNVSAKGHLDMLIKLKDFIEGFE